MKCAKCGKEIEKDSKFCPYCGTKVLSNRQKKVKRMFYTVDYNENKSYDRSRSLFIIGFFAFDIILSTIVGFLGIPNLWVYAISSLIYLASIFYAIRGVLYAIQLKREGKHGSGMFLSCIIMGSSLFILVLNITSIMGNF